MAAANPAWREVSKGEPCPACEKPDWCSITGPEGAIEAAVCMRVESDNARANGGWLHRLRQSSEYTPPRSGDQSRSFATAAEAVAALERTHGRHSHVWKYYNAAGEPVGIVARWNKPGGKEIRPVARVAGGWIIGAMELPRPLYRLAEVRNAPCVFVCEGEPAADAIRSLGLVATTSAGGSAAASKTDWTPLKSKSEVVILPDNDPAGEKYASAVAAILAALSPAPAVKIGRLPGLPAAGDAVDWLAAGGTAKQLAALVGGAPVVEVKPTTKRGPKQTALVAAARQYIERAKGGQSSLITLGIPELDYSIGGGVEFGEMVIAAARPSHGKSAFALQCAHHWTAAGLPVFVASEEMSLLALGKRALQFATKVPQEHWTTSAGDVVADLDRYAAGRADCILSESLATPRAVVEAVERAIDEHGVKCVIVDYAQLLRGDGRSRYEQVTHVSNMLREMASRLGVIVLALCQLNREVEKRSHFIPCVADIKDSGSMEQDADAILLLAWPHRVDSKLPANQFQIFVSKNRNRPINQALVACRFDPSRQTISESTAREMGNYRPEFDADAWESFEDERTAIAPENPPDHLF